MSRDILIDLIDADPDQPRRHFDADQLAELAESIAANGLIVPILLRPVGERFVIVHGERRFRACQSLGWSTIPADVRDMDAETAKWLALVENIQRADLTPIEEAQAYAAALATGLTQLQLGKRIGKTQSYIAQKLRLLKMAPEVQEAVAAGTISEGIARQLLLEKGETVSPFSGAQSAKGLPGSCCGSMPRKRTGARSSIAVFRKTGPCGVPRTMSIFNYWSFIRSGGRLKGHSPI